MKRKFHFLQCRSVNNGKPVLMQKLLGAHPMVVERTEDTVTELSISHWACDFMFLIIATFYFRKGRTTVFTRFPHLPGYICLLMNRAPTRLAKCLEDFLATAGVQSARGGRGGQAVSVPAVGQLLLQSWCQRLHGTNRRLLQRTWVHRGCEISTGKTIYV